MEATIYTHGKLLVTGEYAVLDGALALALPARFGQTLSVKAIEGQQVQWFARDYKGALWMDHTYGRHELLERNWERWESPEAMIGWLLQLIFRNNPELWPEGRGIAFETQLEFPRNWGLGSSSTLLAALAQWAGTDPYVLNERSFGGSGYDIACALAEGPILYQKGTTPSPVSFQPDFTEALHFVHLNQKQDSREGIQRYRNSGASKERLVTDLSEITKALLKTDRLPDFESLISKHETILASALDMTPVKQSRFPDYKGAIKSLGAWGGDFILATGPASGLSYFREKGYETILSYQEMILN